MHILKVREPSHCVIKKALSNSQVLTLLVSYRDRIGIVYPCPFFYSFIQKNKGFLWRLSEVMVNYPLLKLKLKTKIPLVIPENLALESKGLVKRFSKEFFKEIIKREIEKGIK